MNEIKTPDGRVFVLWGSEPYQRKDGGLTTLKVWRATCAVCGAPFEIKTPSTTSAASDSKAFGRKHCDAHKLSPEQVTARWSKACADGKRRKKERNG